MRIQRQVASTDAPVRADRYLRKLCPGLTLSRIHQLFRRKEVKVAGRWIAPGRLLDPGEVVEVFGLETAEVVPPPASPPDDAALDLPVLYEDGEMLVLDKPAGAFVQPGSGVPPGGSIIEKVRLARRSHGGALFRPSLVHRLDRGTSGVLVVAKTALVARELAAAFRERGVRKLYWALAVGRPPKGDHWIRDSLLREPKGGKTRVDEEGKRARTQYAVVEAFSGCSLLRVRIHTGRTHQIRSHLAHAGHPVLGDSRYGNFSANREAARELGLRRLFLHAYELAWHIRRPGPLVFQSSLPQDLEGCLNRLRSGAAITGGSK